MVPGEFSLPFSNLAWPPFSQGFLQLPSAPRGWFPELRQLSELPGKDRGGQVRKEQEGRTKEGGGWTWLRTGLSTEREKRLPGTWDRRGDSDQGVYCRKVGWVCLEWSRQSRRQEGLMTFPFIEGGSSVALLSFKLPAPELPLPTPSKAQNSQSASIPPRAPPPHFLTPHFPGPAPSSFPQALGPVPTHSQLP